MPITSCREISEGSIHPVIAPVSRKMILNYIGESLFGLPKSYLGREEFDRNPPRIYHSCLNCEDRASVNLAVDDMWTRRKEVDLLGWGLTSDFIFKNL